MALAIDGNDTGKSNGTSSVANATGLTTANTSGEIIAFVVTEANGGTNVTVTSVTSAHLTFTQRKVYNGFDTDVINLEEWVAPYSSNLSAEIITAHLSGNSDNAAIGVFGVSGISATKFDTNASWVTTDHTDTDGSGNPQLINQNTTLADTLVLGLFGSSRNSNWGAGTNHGWVSICHILNSSGGLWAEMGAEYQIYSGAQTNFNITTLCGSPNHWGMLGDALTSDTGGGGGLTTPTSGQIGSPLVGIGR